MTDFTTIDYLQHGTLRQQQAFAVLVNNSVMQKLGGFSPILAGTIPLTIDIEGSDLDILCHYSNMAQFQEVVSKNFNSYLQFKIIQTTINGLDTVLANFYCDGFEIEIFGQAVPVTQQAGYLHMIDEHKILLKYGEAFRQQIIALKKGGYKTEPAFAKLLGLKGNPYYALLNYTIT